MDYLVYTYLYIKKNFLILCALKLYNNLSIDNQFVGLTE